MLKKWFKSRSTVSIGIDVDAENISVIIIEKQKGDFKILHKFNSKYDGEDSLHHILRNAMLLSYVSSAIIVSGIADELTVKKYFQLDVSLNDVEIENCVEENANNIFPKCYYDFRIEGINAEDSAKIDVEMVVANKIDVMAHLSQLERSGYRVNIVDIHSAAVERAKNIFSVEEIQSIGENYLISLGLALRGYELCEKISDFNSKGKW